MGNTVNKTLKQKGLLLITALIFFHFIGNAQEGRIPFEPRDNQHIVTPFDRRNDSNLWVIHGRLLPYLFGNGGGFSFLAGMEYGFKRNNSIGFDITRSNFQNDGEMYDTITKEYVPGYASHMVDWAYFFNYRHYLKFYSWRDKKGKIPYVQAFARYCQRHYWYQAGYPTNAISEREWQYSAGIVAGIVHVTENGRFCVDTNLGLSGKKKIIRDIYDDPPGVYIDEREVWYLLPRLGFSFYWWFCRN